MVTLDQIREEIKSRLSIDKELHFVNVHADTIEEALNDAIEVGDEEEISIVLFN